MNIHRQLRWKMTLSYTLVTVGALLVITLIVGGILFSRFLMPANALDPEQMIVYWLNDRTSSSYPMLSRVLSQSPVDIEMLQLYLRDSESKITNSSLFRIGSLEFWATSRASIRILALDAKGVVLGTSVPDDPVIASQVGHAIDPSQFPGLQAPFQAAQIGDTTPRHLYTEMVPNQKYVFASPVFDSIGPDKSRIVGIAVILFDAVPTQQDTPQYILNLAGRSLLIFLLAAGTMGTIFGAFFAHGLAARFKRISAATDLWSRGDFSSYIDDTAGDEISQLAHRLNDMAGQLQGLLRRRQDMAVSEERNRLARDLHDSAKQQALAASFELGTALTLYERDPADAKKHLLEADALVDTVRKELTNLVDELRPPSLDGQDFFETLTEYALDWSHRCGIEVDLDIQRNDKLSLANRETLFRIVQEALANINRHSAARRAGVSLEFEQDRIILTIRDDGRGFDTQARHGGLGLRSMQERAEALGGTLTVESAPGSGTQVRAALKREN